VRDLAVLVLHLLTTIARLAGPGGARSVVAESVLVKHQLLILNRSRKRSPSLRPSDRVVAGLCALFMRPSRLIRSAIVFKPSTLRLHRALIRGKYRALARTAHGRVSGTVAGGPTVVGCIKRRLRHEPCAAYAPSKDVDRLSATRVMVRGRNLAGTRILGQAGPPQ